MVYIGDCDDAEAVDDVKARLTEVLGGRYPVKGPKRDADTEAGKYTRQGPRGVVPCRNLRQTGSCSFGDRCHFRH
jgi:hypothetical protein